MSTVLESPAQAATQSDARGAGGITLTPDQQKALDQFTEFLLDTQEQVFVIEGFSGTGKSTLVKTILERMPKIERMLKLMDFGTLPTVTLTATTNKAAENFQQITNLPVYTIHSHLGLRVQTDYRTGETTLSASQKQLPNNEIIFIDEASYIDSDLLGWIFRRTVNCKIVFMGDPAQLAPVKYSSTPVFEAKFKTAKLTEVMRQAKGNPIVDLSTKFRETVQTGKFFSFKPDGHHIQHLSREDFNNTLLAECSRSDWTYHASKFLAWTNKRVIDYNHLIRDAAKGSPTFAVGDYAVCNTFVGFGKNTTKTDETVCITKIHPDTVIYGVKGRVIAFNGGREYFTPYDRDQWAAAIRKERAGDASFTKLSEMEGNWMDLRAAYAQTVNKSQGSTYDRVWIDLDDISRCNSGDQIARMLYVAVSRARHQVFLTGDLV